MIWKLEHILLKVLCLLRKPRWKKSQLLLTPSPPAHFSKWQNQNGKWLDYSYFGFVVTRHGMKKDRTQNMHTDRPWDLCTHRPWDVLDVTVSFGTDQHDPGRSEDTVVVSKSSSRICCLYEHRVRKTLSVQMWELVIQSRWPVNIHRLKGRKQVIKTEILANISGDSFTVMQEKLHLIEQQHWRPISELMETQLLLYLLTPKRRNWKIIMSVMSKVETNSNLGSHIIFPLISFSLYHLIFNKI